MATWGSCPHACSHAVGLFLKGALLKRDPSLNVWDHNHNLDSLGAAYRYNFQDPRFEWDIPFASRLNVEDWIAQMLKMNPGLMDGVVTYRKGEMKKVPPPSILYRYPVDKDGNEWDGPYGFQPPAFLIVLDRLGKDFERIKSHLV